MGLDENTTRVLLVHRRELSFILEELFCLSGCMQCVHLVQQHDFRGPGANKNVFTYKLETKT